MAALRQCEAVPDGLLVCGDAVCSFNPICRQGMSVAALEAVALQETLQQGATKRPRRYFRAAAKAIGVAWQIAAGSDLAFPEVEGRRTTAMRAGDRFVEPAEVADRIDQPAAMSSLPGGFAVTGFKP